MALINCPECGKEVSDKAKVCPNCGCPSEEWISALCPSVLNRDDVTIFNSSPQEINQGQSRQRVPSQISPRQVAMQQQTSEQQKYTQQGKQKRLSVVWFALAVVAAIVLVTVTVNFVVPAVNYNTAVALYGEEIKNAEVGETFTLGTYEQDNNTTNGKEDIEWLVLAKEDNRVLVISRYALDYKIYNEKSGAITWETCTLRTWLNNDFYSDAFTAQEQSLITQTNVTADKNPKYDIDPGNDTTDKIFLLSINEVEEHLAASEARMCAPTEYAIAQGAWVNDNYKVDRKAACRWWLRSPGSESGLAVRVLDDGSFNYVGEGVGFHNAVRPALWITLGF